MDVMLMRNFPGTCNPKEGKSQIWGIGLGLSFFCLPLSQRSVYIQAAVSEQAEKKTCLLCMNSQPDTGHGAGLKQEPAILGKSGHGGFQP